jgi:hypothetical protein
MALPKSTIAMGLATAALIGLAVYKTKQASDAKLGLRDLDGDGALDEAEGERVPPSPDLDPNQPSPLEIQAEQDERERARKLTAELDGAEAALRTTYGAEVATMGAWFEGASLAKLPEVPPALERKLATSSGTLRSAVGTSRDHHTVEITIGSDLEEQARAMLCDRIEAKLADAWGHPTRLGDDGPQIWMTGKRDGRAVFRKSTVSCRLAFERAAGPASWGSTLKSLLALIGTASAKAAELVHGSVDGDGDDRIRWSTDGVGQGAGPTSFSAEISGDKVSSVVAELNVADSTATEMEQQVTRATGRTPTRARDASEDGDVTTVTWKGARPIRMMRMPAGHVVLMIGTQ